MLVVADEIGMKKAMLVHQFTSQELQPGWYPTISSEELVEANRRLAAIDNQYRWTWVPRVTTLSGSVTLQDRSSDDQIQLCTAGECS